MRLTHLQDHLLPHLAGAHVDALDREGPSDLAQLMLRANEGCNIAVPAVDG